MLLDIHSHILPAVDDGAQDINDSLILLDLMAEQGITHVIATPHFYPHNDTIKDFKARVTAAKKELKANYIGNIVIITGCELFYFNGISKSEHLKHFTLNKSGYILIEPDPYYLTEGFMNEILYMRDFLGLNPIIPHIERYNRCRGYKKFLKFIKENCILTQVNATSFFSKHYTRTLKKLFKENLVTFVATDTHSLNRPPLLGASLNEIEKRFSASEKERIISNLETLYKDITVKENNYENEYAEYL